MGEFLSTDFLSMPAVAKDTPAGVYHELATDRANLEELPPVERADLAAAYPEVFLGGGQAILPSVDPEGPDA